MRRRIEELVRANGAIPDLENKIKLIVGENERLVLVI
jgi:hypothetical protein